MVNPALQAKATKILNNLLNNTRTSNKMSTIISICQDSLHGYVSLADVKRRQNLYSQGGVTMASNNKTENTILPITALAHYYRH